MTGSVERAPGASQPRKRPLSRRQAVASHTASGPGEVERIRDVVDRVPGCGGVLVLDPVEKPELERGHAERGHPRDEVDEGRVGQDDAPERLGVVEHIPLQRVRQQRAAPSPVPLVMLEEERYVIATTLDLAPRLDIVGAVGRGEAERALDGYLLANPAARGALQVVPRFEII